MLRSVIQKSCKFQDNYKLCYWDNNNVDAKKALLFFSAGFDDGSELRELAEFFPDDIRLLSPCFPGRGGSHSLKKYDSFKNIANIVEQWISTLDLNDKEVYFWATSYGTAVLNELIKKTKVQSSGIILLTPGEFLDNTIAKDLLKIGFKRTNTNKPLRSRLHKLLHLFYPFNNNIFLKDNTKSLNEQWLATLDYRIDTSFKTSIPTLIINSANDNIINADSVVKVLEVYQNHKIKEIDHEHIINFFTEKEFSKTLIEKEIIPFIYQ